jgi:hypothetical protein
MSPEGDSLTVLISTNKKHAGKQFRLDKGGAIKNRSYGLETHFRVEGLAVDSIRSLGRALERVSRNPFAFIVRGEPLPDIDRKRARRLLRPDKKTGEPATFVEAARRWVLIDGDAIPCPAAIDPRSDPESAVEHVIGLLPPELHDAWCWWQFSSSQSVFSDETLSLHLWFWLETPLGGDELKRWAIAVNQAAARKLIDPSLFSAVQAHYVAAPDFVAPLQDPLQRRCGLRKGLDETVSLVIPPPHPKRPEEPGATGYVPGRGVAAYLAMIGGPEGFREPIKKAIASFVGSYGAAADYAELKTAIRKAIGRADPGGRSQDELERYSSDQHLDAIIDAIRGYQGDTPGRGFTPEPPPEFFQVPPNLGEGEGPTPDLDPADEAPDIGPLPAEFSEEALALQFSALHCNDWRYTALWGKWLQWLATYWHKEETFRAFDLARAICRRNSAIASPDSLARSIASASTVAAVERLARADRRHAATFDQWDANDLTINQPPGKGATA